MSDGGEVSIKFTAKDQQSLYDAIAEINKRLDQTGVRSEVVAPKLSKADAALKSFADKVKAIQAGPMGELTAETEKLGAALQKNLLTAEEHGAALAAAQEKYAKAIDKTDHELKAFAERIKQLNATPLDRLREKQEMLTRAVKSGELTETQAATAAKRHHDEYQAELDQSKGKQQQLTASGVAWGVTLANVYAKIGQQVTRVFDTMAQEQQKLMDGVKAAGEAMGELSQLQANTPALIEQAEGMFARGEVKTLEEAKTAVFKLESVKAQGAAPMLGKLAGSGVMRNMPEAVDMAERLRSTFGAEGPTAHLDLLGKAQAASTTSTVRLQEVIEAASQAGTKGREMGLSIDELMGASSVMASAKGGATGGTRLREVLTAFSRQEEFSGMTLAQMVAATKEKNLPAKELDKFLGMEGASEGISILDFQKQAVEAATAASSLADGITTLQAAVDDARKNFDVAAAQQSRATAAQAELAGAPSGRIGVAVEAMWNEEIANVRKARRGGPVTELANAVKEASPGLVGGVKDVVNGMTRGLPGSGMLPVAAAGMEGMRRMAGTATAAEIDVALLRTSESIVKWVPYMQQFLAENAVASEETTRLLREAAAGIKDAAGSLKAVSNRRDTIGPARREAAVAAD